MANIQVKIQLQDTVEDTITSMGSPSQSNNASIQKTNNIFDNVSTKNDGRNMKSWAKGYLSLKDGFVGGKDTKLVAQYGYNGYVFGAVPESKQLEVTIEVIGENVDSIMIYGDKEANQFPTKAYIDGIPSKVFYSDDNEFPIRFDKPASASQGETSHTITFLEWNRADYNACITYVGVIKNELWLGNEYVKNVESLSQSTDRPDELFYGVIPSSGSLELIDRNGDLKEYVGNGVIENSNLPIEIYCNGKMVHRHITTDSDYSGNVLSMQFEDELAKWENMQYGGFAYPKHSETAYNMLVDVLRSIGYDKDNETNEEIDEMLDTEIIYDLDNKVGKVSDYLKAISIPYPYLESASVRATIDKFCVLAQLQVLLNDEGKIKFVSARPRATESELENTIPFGKNRIFGTSEKSIIIRNKYEAVEINENRPKFTSVINQSVFDYTISNFETNKTIILTNTSSRFSDTGTITSNNPAYKINEYSFGTAGNRVEGIWGYLEGTYYKLNISVPKYQNYNLKEILRINNSVNATISYKKTKCSASSNVKIPTINDIIITRTNDIAEETNVINNKFDYVTNIYYEDDQYLVKMKLPENNEYIKVLEENENEYIVEAQILIGKRQFGMYCEYKKNDTPDWASTYSSADQSCIYEPIKAEISIYGNSYEISFENILASDNNISEAKTFAHIENNELIQEGTNVHLTYKDNFEIEIFNKNGKYNDILVKAIYILDDNVLLGCNAYLSNGEHTQLGFTYRANTKEMLVEFNGTLGEKEIVSIVIFKVSRFIRDDNHIVTGYEEISNDYISYKKCSDIIKQSIKTDYSNGITTSKITIPCVDYYNEYGNLEKDFAKGEILNVGDVARVVKNEKIRQKATGRTFRKQGVPMIDLELQEINENFDN